MPSSTLNLRKGMRLGVAPRLAVIGAGGKTTFLFQLAGEFSPRDREGRGGTVLVTTTTHLGVGQVGAADHHLTIAKLEDLDVLETSLPEGVVLLTGQVTADQRLSSPDPQLLARLVELSRRQQIPLLVEADGSRLRPLKAPAEHEPALPFAVHELDVVVVVAGLSGLGKPLTPEWVHRPKIFGALAGIEPGERITPQALSRVLIHDQGGLKGIPARCRRVALLNQASTPELQAQARGMAWELLQGYDAVLVANLADQIHAVHEPVAGIILAAGESLRFGQPKQTLPWRGQPLIRHVARTALQAGLNPVIVVTGAHADEISAVLEDLPVLIAHNPDWQLGQSASVQTGLKHLPEKSGAAIFLLADQPQVPATLLQKLVETHAAGLSELVSPQADGRRANPVLFDRVTFAELMTLRGDVGGRPLFARYPVEWVPWHDASLLLDVDTPEDYARLLDMEDNLA